MMINEDGEKVLENMEDAWEAVLELWKYLSELDTDEETVTAKHRAVHDLGYMDMRSGCPFCEMRLAPGKATCNGCPVYDIDNKTCGSTPYQDYSAAFEYNMSLALTVYEYLLGLRERYLEQQRKGGKK